MSVQRSRAANSVPETIPATTFQVEGTPTALHLRAWGLGWPTGERKARPEVDQIIGAQSCETMTEAVVAQVVSLLAPDDGGFDELVVRPAKRLPVIVGELGPQQDRDVTMFPEDCEKLFDVAEGLDVPWITWSFHNNCPPNLLVERKNACVAGASLEPSPWGRLVKARLARPW